MGHTFRGHLRTLADDNVTVARQCILQKRWSHGALPIAHVWLALRVEASHWRADPRNK